MMSRKTAERRTIVTLTFCGLAYFLYALAAETGLYTWLVDIDLALQGNGPYVVHAYWLSLAFFIISLGICIAAIVAACWVIDRLPLPPAAMSDVPAPAPTPAAVNKTGTAMLLFFLLASLVPIGVGAYTGLIYYHKSSEAVTFEPLNLTDGIPPRSTRVKLTGLVVPSLEIQYTKGYRYSFLETYIPVLPPQWHRGDPVVYFLHPHGDFVQPSKPAMIGQTGLLIRDGLPGAATFLFKKHGITLGTPPIVLDTDEHADLDPYLYTAIGGGAIGLSSFFLLAVALVRGAWAWFVGRFGRSRLAS